MACALAAFLAACGAGSGQPGADAGSAPSSLVISSNESIGLGFGQRATMSVRYLGAGMTPLPGRTVSFAIAADLLNESAGGSSLSASSAGTDAAGVATVDVAAGAAAASFRVVAEASGAPPATVYVTVTDQGFADLTVRAVHAGWRNDADLATVELRLYMSGDKLRCATLTPESTPVSPYPPRTLTMVGATAEFPALAASQGYALLGWGTGAGGKILATACVDVGPRQLRAGVGATLDLPVADRPLTLAPSYAMTSTIGLVPVQQVLVGPGTAWATAKCARGAAQLVLDCAIDFLDAGDPDDCVVAAPGPTAQALLAARGPADAAGCRPSTLAGGEASIDAQVMTVLLPVPAAAALPSSARQLHDLLNSVSIESVLEPAGRFGLHRLTTVGLEGEGVRYQTNIAATARPVLLAPTTLEIEGPTLGVGTHAFSLRLGSLLAAAFTAQTGLGAPTKLGPALLGNVGCAAVSEAACVPAGLPADCLAHACADSQPALSNVLAAPFTRLTTTTVDLELDGTALLADDNHDVTVDRLRSGLWRGSVILSNGDRIAVSGVFQTN